MKSVGRPEARHVRSIQIPRRLADTPTPLSFAQQRLWFLDRLAAGSSFYNVPSVTPIHGHVDVAALQWSLNEIVRRHEALRTSFPLDGDQPVQHVHPEPRLPLVVVDLGSVPRRLIEARATAEAEAEARTTFDLEHGPVIRAKLLRLSSSRHWLLLTIHHIATDGWSMGLLAQELSRLYAARVAGRPNPLEDLPIQYADYAVWQRDWLRGDVLTQQLDYWRTQLAGVEPVRLITDRTRGPATFEGDFCPLEVAPQLLSALRSMAASEKATLYMALLAAFDVLMCRLTGQDDIVVGSPIANRSRPELEGLIGFFVNTLVLRVDLSGSPSFREVLRRTRATALDAFAHQDIPFEKLVEELRPDRDADRNPLFQIGFVLQTAWAASTGAPLSDGDKLPEIQRGTSIFDLAVHLWEQGDKVVGGIEYSTGLFDRPTIERISHQFVRLIEAIATDPDAPIAALPLVSEHERHRVVVGWNRTTATTPSLAPLPVLIAENATANPEAIAVRCRDESVTYEQFDRRVNHFGHVLMQQGLGRGEVVGICLPRSIDVVAMSIAVMRVGAAFLPLDPDYPAERISFMVEDSAAALVVSSRATVDSAIFAETPRIWLEDIASESATHTTPAPDVDVAPDGLAYVIYTSGSTGRPKGVLLEHRGLSNVVAGQREVLGVGRNDRVLQFAPLSFDASVFEFAMALGLGGTLCVAAGNARYPGPELTDLLRRERVTVATLPPSALAVLPDADLPDLATILVAGEACPAAQVDRWARGRRFFNLYGPTETTIWATAAECVPTGSRPTIGRPIPNTRVYLLDSNGEPVPVGVAGEIYIGGVGVARGYLGRPELTAERFVERDIGGVGGERLYRSGDVGRHLADGQIDFLGRADRQVKVRGHRVELEEIESVLSGHPAIQEAVVVVREDEHGEQRVVAYVTTPNEFADSDAMAISAEHVSYWRTLYDDVYVGATNSDDPQLNIAGWESSYTGEMMRVDEMREWVDATVARIGTLSRRRVVEIGCGSGLLLLRIAPTVEHYSASDFSDAALRVLGEELARCDFRSRVSLSKCEAVDFGWPNHEREPHDLVVINSVSQYFPSASYLRDVLTRAIDSLAGGGTVFVGDVRSLAMLDTFSLSVELARMDPDATIGQVLERASRRVALERELVVDPEFFFALHRETPRVSGVEILVKRGRHVNELSKFRYDVLLHVGTRNPVLGDNERWDWVETLDVPAIVSRLDVERPPVVHLAGVANGRVEGDLRVRALAGTMDPSTPAASLCDEATSMRRGVDPEELARGAERIGYRVELHDSCEAGAGTFDAVLARSDTAAAFEGRLPAPPPRDGVRRLKPWNHYTNSPWRGVFLRTIVPHVRGFLAARLPDHLIPSHFVPLAHLPLTPSGKVDRSALPAPERARPDLAVEYVAPTLPAEKTLAAIWAEALRVEDIGIHDNYFDLGGDSILGIQIVTRARAAGLEMAPRDLFEHQTIAELIRSCVRVGAPVESVTPVVDENSNGEARPAASRFALSGLSDAELTKLVGRLGSKRE
jgi:amino acid adenylation domain-containing protein